MFCNGQVNVLTLVQQKCCETLLESHQHPKEVQYKLLRKKMRKFFLF